MKETKGKKIRELARTAQGGICLFLILSGMCLCMEALLSIPIPWQARLTAAAALAAVSLLMQKGWKWILAEILILIGGMIVFCVKYQEVLLIGMKEAANRILDLVNAYHRTEYLLFYLDTQESYGWVALLLVFVLLGFFEGLLLMPTRSLRHHFLITAMLPVLIIAAGLMVGWAACFAGILLVFAGLLLEAVDVKERGSLLLGGAVAVSIAVPVLLMGNGKFWAQIELWHEDWYARQIALEDQMMSFAEQVSDISLFSSGEMKQYALKNGKPVYSGKEVFKITVDYPISSPLYIRGFAGGAYEDGTWKRISRQEFSDWAQQQGGDEETYAEIVQSFPYDLLEYSAQLFWAIGRKKHVSMELAQKSNNYTLIPYFTNFTEGQALRADGIYPPGKETRYEWDSYMGLTDYDINISSSIYMEDWQEYFTLSPEIMRKSKVFTAYQKYVQEHYTRLPEEGLQKLRDYVKQYQKTHPTYSEGQKLASDKLKASGENAWDYTEMERLLTEEELQLFTMTEREYDIQTIQKMLWEQNWYSLDLEEVPKGEDSVEYFLFEQHKGYCAHFASAATLLLRMHDIPARYASGYIVMPSDFEKNEDGTWTASVTDERSHAWTEIFYDSIGFCPLETTPPEYTELLENMEEGETLAHVVEREEAQKKEEQVKQEAREKEENQQQQEQKENQQQQQEQKKQQEQGSKSGAAGSAGIHGNGRIWKVLRIAAAAIAGISMICLLLWWRRRWVLRDRQRRFTLEERTQAVREIGREMGKILCLLGVKRQAGMDDRGYVSALEQELPGTCWERIFFIFQKAEFSEHGVTEEEYREILSAYRKLELDLVSGGGIKGWYLCYIKIYS